MRRQGKSSLVRRTAGAAIRRFWEQQTQGGWAIGQIPGRNYEVARSERSVESRALPFRVEALSRKIRRTFAAGSPGQSWLLEGGQTAIAALARSGFKERQ